MKACIVFTGTGPILILTTYESLNDQNLIDKLFTKGIQKFMAYEVPLEMVKVKYEAQFTIVMNDVKQTDDLRVLDYNGHNIFYNFDLSKLSDPVFHEPSPKTDVIGV